MAFAMSAGYNNLPNGNFVPTIYSQKVLKFFRKASVVEDITNNDYYGEIANYGDTVRVILEPTITVTAYTRGATLVPQDLPDNDISITVDKANSFQFKIDDIEDRQTHVNWEDMASNAGAYALKDTYDSEVLTYIEGQVPTANKYFTAGAPGDLGFEATDNVTPLQIVNRLDRLMNEANVPTDQRWLVAGPTFWEQMGDESNRFMEVMVTGDSKSPLRNGKVSEGLIHGFTCYRSNNLPTPSSSKVVLAGHMSGVATASQIAKIEKVRDPFSFADVVRGLHVYGRKVIRTESIYSAYYTVD